MNRHDIEHLVGEQMTTLNAIRHDDALARTGFWGARGAGAIVVAHDTGRLLLPLRSDAVLEPGTWGTWGGAVDSGESPIEAVRRELREETGCCARLRLEPLMVFRRSGFAYHNFLGVVPHEFTPRLDWETAGFAWVPLDHLPHPLHFGLKALLRDPASVRKIKQVTR